MYCSEFLDDMMDVLYGEADAEVEARFKAHQASCRACREELADLETVRRDLQTWGVEGQPRRRRLFVPAWRGLAAAAAVLLAFTGGLFAARTDVSLRDGSLQVRFGNPVPAADVQGAPALREAEHREAIQALPASVTAPSASLNEAAILRRVQEMIRESEARQTVLMQTSLGELGQRADAQRRYDLARVSAGLSYLESKTGADVARTNELMSRVLKVSQDEGK